MGKYIPAIKEVDEHFKSTSYKLPFLVKAMDDSQQWERPWPEVAAELCSVDDGLPVELDGLRLTRAQHRAAQLKAYGNAIVPQVAMEIMETMTSGGS